MNFETKNSNIAKFSATWGARASDSATWGCRAADSAYALGNALTQSLSAIRTMLRAESFAKSALVLLLCLGILAGSPVTASAGNGNSLNHVLQNKLSPELQAALANAKPGDKFDVIIQLNQKPQQSDYDDYKGNGGVEHRRLHLINASSLNLPARAIRLYALMPKVRYISLNRHVTMSLDHVTKAVTADIAWSYGYDGTGVGIAVVDSGVYQHPDLNGTNGQSRVVYSESFVTGDSTTGDAYGHGTHVSGIAAGNGSSSETGSGYMGDYQGIAPNANIINLRVLDANGGGTDDGVIAAIQRAIQLKSTYNIRVLNLSLGRPVFESYSIDPLCQAVEQAWQAGIVVVVAAGNSGRDNSLGTNGYGTINAPGNDPYVITVGAMNMMGTFTRSDDVIASYSSKGPTLLDHIVKPDLVAPGNKVVSLYDPSGTLEANNPSLDVFPGCGAFCSSSVKASSYFQLSGTSMATPVVSGAAALMLQANPSLTPDIVKARMMKSAYKNLAMYSIAYDAQLHSYQLQRDIFTYGAGYLDINAALNNHDTGTGVAVSPTVSLNAVTGKVSISATSILWGNSVLWGSSVLWGNSIVWGASAFLDANSVLWGDSVIWGASASGTQGFSVLWGSSVLWGQSGMQAMSAGDPGDCIVDDSGNLVCQ